MTGDNRGVSDAADPSSEPRRPGLDPAASPPADRPEDHPRGERPPGAALRLALLIGGIVALGVLGSVSAVIVVLALVVMIFLHELGHYVMARRAGMKVTEFFIGFGPKIWSFRRGETEYGLKVIPAGAYVRIIGMNNLDPVDPADESRTYRQASYPKKMGVALAGSTMHFLIALVLLFVLIAGWGLPREENWEVGAISRLETGPSPAQEAGLELGDRIVAVDGLPTPTFEAASGVIQERPGEEVVLTVDRDGETLELTTTLADRHPEGQAVGFLGVGPDYPLVRESIPTAAVRSVTELGDSMWLSVRALGSFFTPSSLGRYVEQVVSPEPASITPDEEGETSGDNRLLSPVGAVRIASQAADAGIPELLSFLIAINIFIGIFNLVPLLPLDGGHVAIATYERLRSRNGKRYQVDVSKLLPITYAVVVVLVFLGLTALYLDVTNPIADPFAP